MTDTQLADALQTTLLTSRGIEQDRWLLPALLPLLAQGQPVSSADLARATGRAEQDVQQTLSRQGDLETDEHGHVVGYGLTLRPHLTASKSTATSCTPGARWTR